MMSKRSAGFSGQAAVFMCSLHKRHREEIGEQHILLRGMAFNIKDPAADRLARELAHETGESITAAVTVAVRERLERLRGAVPQDRRQRVLTQIAQRSAGRRVLAQRTPEEIVGYEGDGLPS